jgi:hypothetical protein
MLLRLRGAGMLETGALFQREYPAVEGVSMSKLDPRDLYELDSDRPDLTDVVLVHALDGFIDAGATTRIAREHLLAALDGSVIARFDVDQLFDYRARRPIMQFARDHWESYNTPELSLHLLRDQEAAPFLLLAGPEPDVQWERFVAAIGSLVADLGVRLTVGLNAFPMSLPHTRPTRVIAHGSRPELFAGNEPWLGVIAVPASVGHLIEFRFGQAGLDALGLAAPVPPYVADTEFPAASAALLRELSLRTGLVLPLAALDDAAEKNCAAIDEQVAQSEEIQALVTALEQQYDAFSPGSDRSLLASSGGLPSAEELGAELERFLAEQTRGGDTPPV